jgi:hypothetical protein
MRPWRILLDKATRRNLDVKSKAHGVSRPDFVRALINGHRPGAVPGSPAALADAWWDSRTPARRVSIWRNHATTSDAVGASHGVGQLTIEDVFASEGEGA